ncbi:hypothetical protein HKCCE4037_06585 [Rhodobacterales bacterium HKCCE4037]|nr:hypothetical protein [Rhodobacterales bacterium HKCCE4037]
MMQNLTDILAALEPLTYAQRWAFFESLERQGKASLVRPSEHDTWDPKLYAIRALGIDVMDTGRDAAINQWMECAGRIASEAMDLNDLITWALDTIEGPGEVRMAEAVDAARILIAHADFVGRTSVAIARGVLKAIANSSGGDPDDLTAAAPATEHGRAHARVAA